MMMEEINKWFGWLATREPFHVFSGLTGAAVVKLVIGRKWISNFARVNKEYERFTLNRGNGLHYYLHHEHCYAPLSLSLSLPYTFVRDCSSARTRHVGLHVFHISGLARDLVRV